MGNRSQSPFKRNLRPHASENIPVLPTPCLKSTHHPHHHHHHRRVLEDWRRGRINGSNRLNVLKCGLMAKRASCQLIAP